MKTLSLLNPMKLKNIVFYLALSTAVFTGCTASEGDCEGDECGSTTPITHTQAHELIRSNLDSHAARIDQRLSFLNGDENLSQIFGSVFNSEDCLDDFQIEEEDSVTDCGSENEPLELNFVQEMEEITNSVLEMLPEDQLIEDNLQLTYAIDPSDMCDITSDGDDFGEEDFGESFEPLDAPPIGEFEDEEPRDDEPRDDEPREDDFRGEEPRSEDADPACLEAMQNLTPRLELTATGDRLTTRLLVNTNAQSSELIKLYLDPQIGKVTLDLKVLIDTIREIDTNAGQSDNEEMFDLPNIEGKISLSVDTSSADQLVLAFNIDQEIRLTGDFESELEAIDITIPAATPLLSLTFNQPNSSIRAALDLPQLVIELTGALNFQGDNVVVFDDSSEGFEERPEDFEERPDDFENRPDDFENRPNERMRALVLNLGGVNLAWTVQVQENLQSSFEFGLGDQSTRLSVDSQEVLTLDLNPNHGRRIALDFQYDHQQEDQLMIALAAMVAHVQISTNFQGLEDFEIEEMFAQEVFSLTLEGTTGENPRVLLGADAIRVEEGRLTLSAQNSGSEVVAEAGQCLMSDQSDDFEDRMSFPEEQEPAPNESTQDIFDELMVEMCESLPQRRGDLPVVTPERPMED